MGSTTPSHQTGNRSTVTPGPPAGGQPSRGSPHGCHKDLAPVESGSRPVREWPDPRSLLARDRRDGPAQTPGGQTARVWHSLTFPDQLDSTTADENRIQSSGLQSGFTS